MSKYTSYISISPRFRTIAPSGKVIQFQAGQYITDDQECISYLDEQIKLKAFDTVQKGEAVDSPTIDPMADLKRKIIKEYLEKEQSELAPDYGKSESAGINAATSATLSKIAKESSGK